MRGSCFLLIPRFPLYMQLFHVLSGIAASRGAIVEIRLLVPDEEIMRKQDPPSTSAYVRARNPLSICTVPGLFMAISLSSVAAERRALIAT